MLRVPQQVHDGRNAVQRGLEVVLRRPHHDGLFDLAHPLVHRQPLSGIALGCVGHQIFFTRMRIGWLSPTTASTPWPSGRACAEPDEPNCTESVSTMISC